MIKPVRVQRKRTKGFNLQAASPNGLPVVYVGRPTMYGNQFGRTDISLWLYENFWREYVTTDPKALEALRGKNLACFCPLTDKNGKPIPCHADILLRLANA